MNYNKGDVGNFQGHPTDLFLTISVLQRNFCWLGTEVSAVLLGSKVLNLRSRIYQMYQKFLLEIFYPSNLLEIFLGCISSWVSGVIGSSQVAPLCARIVRAESRAYDLFTADQKICTWAPWNSPDSRNPYGWYPLKMHQITRASPAELRTIVWAIWWSIGYTTICASNRYIFDKIKTIPPLWYSRKRKD